MSLSAPYDPNNIFAKIIAGQIPSVKVHEDDDNFAFMDIFPQAEGHCLVIPKGVSATNLFDVPADRLKSLIISTQVVAAAVKAALSPAGVRIAQFNGAPAGQTVFHLHFHIIPVYEGAVERPHAAGKPADTARLEDIAGRIRAHL